MKRKVGQSFVINGEMIITVAQIRGKQAVLQIDGPFSKYEVLRLEIERDETLRQARLEKMREKAPK